MPTPCGAWPSTLAATALAAGAVRRGEPRATGRFVFWAEGRPSEGGRTALVRHDLVDDTTADFGPADLNVRSMVHEYGGAAWFPRHDGVIGVDLGSQRIGRITDASIDWVTDEPQRPRTRRYADPVASGPTSAVWVEELHGNDHDVVNRLVEVTDDGSIEVIDERHDFVAAPTISVDGRRLAYLGWDHPNMPWDDVTLWCCDRTDAGWGSPRRIASGAALQQPRFDRADQLHVISDHTGFWHVHPVGDIGSGDAAQGDLSAIGTALTTGRVELGVPSWTFGNRTYDWSPDGALWCTWIDAGVAHLGVDDGDGLRELDVGFTEFGRIEALDDGRLVAIASSWTEPATVVIIDRAGDVERLSAPSEVPISTADISSGEPITFEDDHGRIAHAFFFAPHHPDCRPVDGELPPLIVLSHGGPTGNARSSLDLGIQYWTSRGIAVVDVNYGGSTGYGTEYRNRLRGQWGVVDRRDCVRAALHLAAEGRVDADRLVIKGGSAGGYTTLGALVFDDAFAAGISRYGVADLATLATDTHKFEARYLDSLVGPWPEASDIYRERSPIHHTDRLQTPMIVLQGTEDAVVPPSQAEQLVSALSAAGIAHAYLLFDGEGHGFRRADTIATALEAELSFLGQMLGFEPAGDIDRVQLR